MDFVAFCLSCEDHRVIQNPEIFTIPRKTGEVNWIRGTCPNCQKRLTVQAKGARNESSRSKNRKDKNG